jgi:hypothetical protein
MPIYFAHFDPLFWVLSLPALALAFYAQWKVRSAFGKYAQVPNERGLTGAEAAQQLVRANALDVTIGVTPGELSDHYDPRAREVRLSGQVAHQASIASLAIVAHELGHAMQDAQAYAPLRFRNAIVPGVQLGSWLGPILFIVGAVMGLGTAMGFNLAAAGVVLFAGAFVFAVITWPVERDASRRALDMLRAHNLLGPHDMRGASSVLKAAELTYIAAMAQALGQLVYFVLILSGGRRRD